MGDLVKIETDESTGVPTNYDSSDDNIWGQRASIQARFPNIDGALLWPIIEKHYVKYFLFFISI